MWLAHYPPPFHKKNIYHHGVLPIAGCANLLCTQISVMMTIYVYRVGVYQASGTHCWRGKYTTGVTFVPFKIENKFGVGRDRTRIPRFATRDSSTRPRDPIL